MKTSIAIATTAGAIAAGTLALPASAAPVYFNGFDGAATVAPGVTATLSGMTDLGTGSGSGLTGSFLRNRSTGNPAASTVLTLSNLPTHTTVDIGMVFAFLDSWDGTSGSVSPDLVDIVVDGTTRISGLTYNNNTGASGQYIGAGTLLGERVQADDNLFFSDTTVDLGTSGLLSFGHTSSTLTLTIFAYGAGWQGGTDEAWGIDNLTVDVNAVAGVPEPTSWAMMIGGVGLAGGALRRRKASASVRYT